VGIIIITFIYHTRTGHIIQKLNSVNKSIWEGYQRSYSSPNWPPMLIKQKLFNMKCKKDNQYSITERRVPELIPVLGSQPAGDMSHKPGGRLPLVSARLAVTLETLKRAATNFAAW